MSPLLWVVAAALVLLAVGNAVAFRAGRDRAGVVSLGRPIFVGSTPRWWPQLRRPSEGTLLFAACSIAYLAVAAYLVLHRGSIVGDAESRVAQAWYVVASRDPHLAAIGFVWNPLPSAAAIPFVLLRGIWPALTHDAFAGSIVSALCMAGAVVQFRAALREIGLAHRAALILTACFALNPMTVYYGANGMSEAMYLLFLIGATRYLLAWTVTGRLRPLVLCAVNLALGYLTRYETLAAGLAVLAVVFVVGTWARNSGLSRRDRMTAAGADVAVVAIPLVVAFLAWAIVSWVITGQPFEQFTSRYGNASILQATGGAIGANGTGWPKIVLAMVQTMSYAPLIVPLAILAVAVAVRRKDRRFLALGALLAPLAFSILAYSAGQTFGFLRFYIPVLPAFLLGAGLLLSPLPKMRPATPSWMRGGRIAGVVVALLIALPCVVGSSVAMANPRTGPTEQAGLAWLFRPARSLTEKQNRALLPSTQSIAHQVDQLGLPDASVALDTNDCGTLIVMNSEHPHQFVITSDRDFEEAVADPLAFGVPYLLVPNGDKGIEAISLVHPGVFQGGRTGDLQTAVVGQFTTLGCPTYRLLRVTKVNS